MSSLPDPPSWLVSDGRPPRAQSATCPHAPLHRADADELGGPGCQRSGPSRTSIAPSSLRSNGASREPPHQRGQGRPLLELRGLSQGLRGGRPLAGDQPREANRAQGETKEGRISTHPLLSDGACDRSPSGDRLRHRPHSTSTLNGRSDRPRRSPNTHPHLAV